MYKFDTKSLGENVFLSIKTQLKYVIFLKPNSGVHRGTFCIKRSVNALEMKIRDNSLIKSFFNYLYSVIIGCSLGTNRLPHTPG